MAAFGIPSHGLNYTTGAPVNGTAAVHAALAAAAKAGPEVEKVVTRALAVEAEGRFASADAFRKALDEASKRVVEREKREAKKGAEPASLEEILAKKKAEEEAAAKPRFVTKAERQQAALAKLAARGQADRARVEAERTAARDGIVPTGPGIRETLRGLRRPLVSGNWVERG